MAPMLVFERGDLKERQLVLSLESPKGGRWVASWGMLMVPGMDC